MANPYIGQVSPFAFSYAPASWAFCNGASVPLNQFATLYALMGTAFGGNGRTSFNLPNLNGMAPCGTGQGTGLTNRGLGDMFGTPSVTLDLTTLAGHQHGASALPLGRGIQASGTPQSTSGIANQAGGGLTPYANGSPNATMSPSSISSTGAGGAHNNLQPYIALNYCIALYGEFPTFP